MINLSTSLPRLLFALTITIGSWQTGLGVAQAKSVIQPAQRAILVDSISNLELKKYAQSLIEIEPLRLAALESIKSKTNGRLPNLVCNQPNSINALNANSRRIFINYCNHAQGIASKHGMNIRRFNDITSSILASPALQERLQKQVTCLQNGRC